jgi:hypothetical protein
MTRLERARIALDEARAARQEARDRATAEIDRLYAPIMQIREWEFNDAREKAHAPDPPERH